MRFAIVFFIALLALTLARPYFSGGSDSDEHSRTRKPHHKHHHRHTRRPPPPPRTVAPLTTEESPVVSDAPSDALSNPTEIGPIATIGDLTTGFPEITSAVPEGTIESVSVSSKLFQR